MSVAVRHAACGVYSSRSRPPTAPAGASCGDAEQLDPRLEEAHDELSTQAVAEYQRADQHHLGVGHEMALQAARQLALELGLSLEVVPTAVLAGERAPDPHQRRQPLRHLQIASPPPASTAPPPGRRTHKTTPRDHGRVEATSTTKRLNASIIPLTSELDVACESSVKRTGAARRTATADLEQQMAVSLADHFNQHEDNALYRFLRSEVRVASPHDDLVEALAELLARNKSDPDVTADLLSTLGWSTAVAALRQGRVPVQRGDFGEVLAAEAAEAFDGSTVPVRKLRYQVDPNQTLPGSDVVAFVLDDAGEISTLDFIESKYRSNPRSDLAVNAHDQIAADRDDGYATTLNFLANRLHEYDKQLYRSFMRYLAADRLQDTRTTISLSFDEEHWDERVARKLDDIPTLLPNLRLRLFFLLDANNLIDEVYERVHAQVVGR